MFRYSPSIRKKITFGYYIFVALILGMSVVAFVELRSIGKKIIFGETISEFFDTTLEIRRFEKNYFLYKQESDYEENLRYVIKAQELIDRDIEEFKTLAHPQQIVMLRNDLARYKELMERYASALGIPDRQNDVQGSALEARIRETGKEIITVAEGIAKAERKKLQTLLYDSLRNIISSIIVLSLLGLIMGQVLSRMLVRPLKSIEESMRVIAEGKFEKVSIDSKDREIVSLTNAINKMLRELELRQRHLVQSEKLASLGTLLSGVAHELNNPLSNISSSCQILMEEIEDADTEYKRELLAQMDEQTDRARNIVRSLLEFSRDKEFKKEMLPLRKLLEETIRFVKGQVPTRVAISMDVPDDIVIFADKQRIQQAFLNLIKNAIESTAEEGAILINARKHKAVGAVSDETGIDTYMKCSGKCTMDEEAVDITIRDTGSGIPPEVVSKIFDPFFTTKDVGKGSGLGLFVVHEIIEEHDGCIAVDSEVGKGTTFLIRLALKEL